MGRGTGRNTTRNPGAPRLGRAAAILLLVSGLASAASAPLDQEAVVVSLRLHGTWPGGAADVRGSGDTVLSSGERRGVYAAASAGLCSAAVGGADRLEDVSPSGFVEHLWWADVELLDYGVESIRLRVDWKRLDRAGDDLVFVKGGTRTVTLREGQTHMLDFVPEPRRDRGQMCYENLLVDLTASVREDPALRDETLRYDLWFVDESPDGKRTARASAVGKQGESVPLRLEPIRWPVAEDVFEGGRDADVVIEPSATVRGRLRRDGTIDVELRADRWFGVAEEGKPRRGGVGDGGTRLFSATPGETVEMVLPDPEPRGSHGLARSDDGRGRALFGPARGVVLDEEEIRVGNAKFFEGHRMYLLLTLTRL